MGTYSQYVNCYDPPCVDENGRSPLAWVTLGLGLGSWLVLPVVGAVAAVICGLVERRKIAEGTSCAGGRSIATLGLVLGAIQIGLFGLTLIGGTLFGALMMLGAVVA